MSIKISCEPEIYENTEKHKKGKQIINKFGVSSLCSSFNSLPANYFVFCCYFLQK